MEKSEKKYQALKKEYDQFTYIVTHDMKAALRGISTLTGFLKEDIGSNLNQQNALQMQMMMEKVKKMQMMMDGLYSYAKCDKEDEAEIETDLNKLFEKIAIKTDIPVDRLELSLELNSIVTNAGKLESVLTQILQNSSIHNMGKDDLKINIAVKKINDSLSIMINDNGQGLEERYFQKAFDPLVSLHQNENSPTTGMGLTIAKKIIFNKGGDIFLSKTEGEGLTVNISWPI